MIDPAQPTAQIDMGRVVQRAADNVAGAVSTLAAQLGMTQEVADVRAARIAELEEQLEAKSAELTRVQQTADMLQQQLDGQAGEDPAAG